MERFQLISFSSSLPPPVGSTTQQATNESSDLVSPPSTVRPVSSKCPPTSRRSTFDNSPAECPVLSPSCDPSPLDSSLAASCLGPGFALWTEDVSKRSAIPWRICWNCSCPSDPSRLFCCCCYRGRSLVCGRSLCSCPCLDSDPYPCLFLDPCPRSCCLIDSVGRNSKRRRSSGWTRIDSSPPICNESRGTLDRSCPPPIDLHSSGSVPLSVVEY